MTSISSLVFPTWQSVFVLLSLCELFVKFCGSALEVERAEVKPEPADASRLFRTRATKARRGSLTTMVRSYSYRKGQQRPFTMTSAFSPSSPNAASGRRSFAFSEMVCTCDVRSRQLVLIPTAATLCVYQITLMV